jgi:hypothetical protein
MRDLMFISFTYNISWLVDRLFISNNILSRFEAGFV